MFQMYVCMQYIYTHLHYMQTSNYIIEMDLTFSIAAHVDFLRVQVGEHFSASTRIVLTRSPVWWFHTTMQDWNTASKASSIPSGCRREWLDPRDSTDTSFTTSMISSALGVRMHFLASITVDPWYDEVQLRTTSFLLTWRRWSIEPGLLPRENNITRSTRCMVHRVHTSFCSHVTIILNPMARRESYLSISTTSWQHLEISQNVHK